MGDELREVRLGEVARVKHGFAFDGQWFVEEPSRDVLVTPGNFEIGGGFKLDKLKYYRGPVPDEYVLSEGDLIVTMTDLSKASDTLGYSAVVPRRDPLRFLHNQRTGKLEITRLDLVDKEFLYWLLRTPQYRAEVLASATGTAVKHTAPSRIEAFRFVPPELMEQRAIAHILGTLDDKIELNRQTNETIEEMARAIFKSWFVDFDPVHAKAEGRRPRGMDAETAKLFPSAFEESAIGELPKGWTTAPVYELATYINGAAYRAFEPNEERRGLPIIKIAELKAGVTEQTKFSEVAMPEKYRIDRGDLLFSWSGNPDASIDTFVWPHDPAWLNQHIFRVVPHRKEERAFVLATLRYLKPVFAEIARNKQTTGLGHVTVDDMKRLLVVRPDDNALRCWNAVAEPLFGRLFQNEVEGQTLVATRDALLPRLLSGDLRVHEAEGTIQEAT